MGYPLILFFSSTYCAPCKPVAKMLNEINMSLFGNKLRIKKIDIAKDMEKARRYDVISVPTILIGNVRLSVIIDKSELTDAILQGFLSSVSLSDEEEMFEEEDEDTDDENKNNDNSGNNETHGNVNDHKTAVLEEEIG